MGAVVKKDWCERGPLLLCRALYTLLRLCVEFWRFNGFAGVLENGA